MFSAQVARRQMNSFIFQSKHNTGMHTICILNILIGKFFQSLFFFTTKILFKKEMNHIHFTMNTILSSRFMRNLTKNKSGDNLLEALIAGEDIRFQHHCGIDFIAISRAILKYISSKKVEGASTIEQQLTRTIISDYRFSFKRKIKECILASSLCRTYNKRDTALCYLILAYYGYKMSGLRQATDFLNIDYTHISTYDSALIVAALKYPYPKANTASHRNKHETRVKYILETANRRHTGAWIYSTLSLRRPRN